MKVLIVDDDMKLSSFLVRALNEEGFDTSACDNGAEALKVARADAFDLIVLDWMLPDTDGIDVCKSLRSTGCTTPIVMLTARGETPERVTGLDAGADDFVAKPFELAELLARCRALIRRANSIAPVAVGDLRIDRVAHAIRVGGRDLDLTSREYAILAELAQHTEKPVSRTELLHRIWGPSHDAASNLVEVHVSRLRDKLGSHAWMIETARGVGYRLVASRAQ